MDKFPMASWIGDVFAICVASVPRASITEWDTTPFDPTGGYLPTSEWVVEPSRLVRFPQGGINLFAFEEKLDLVIYARRAVRPYGLNELQLCVPPAGIQNAEWDEWEEQPDVSLIRANETLKSILRCVDMRTEGALSFSLINMDQPRISGEARNALLELLG